MQHAEGITSDLPKNYLTSASQRKNAMKIYALSTLYGGKLCAVYNPSTVPPY